MVAISAPSASPGGRGTITTFRLTAWTPAAFKSRLRSRKPACRFLRTQSRSIASAVLYTMRSTGPKLVARSMWSPSPAQMICTARFSATCRNSVFDARNFNDFDVNGNPAIPPFRFGQYGMCLGGPVVKNKLFFFLNYEGLRQYGGDDDSGRSCLLHRSRATDRSGQSTSQDSRRKCVPSCRPFRGAPPRVRSGSAIRIHVYPDGAFADQTSQGLPDSDLFTAPAPTTVHEDTWLVRMDYKINNKILLYGRAQRDISLVSGTNGSGPSLRPDSNHQSSRRTTSSPCSKLSLLGF